MSLFNNLGKDTITLFCDIKGSLYGMSTTFSNKGAIENYNTVLTLEKKDEFGGWGDESKEIVLKLKEAHDVAMKKKKLLSKLQDKI